MADRPRGLSLVSVGPAVPAERDAGLCRRHHARSRRIAHGERASLSWAAMAAQPSTLTAFIRPTLGLLDQPEDGERVAIVLCREVGDWGRLRRPRHQLLDQSFWVEARPEGEMLMVRPVVVVLIPFPATVGIVETDKISPVGLHISRKLSPTGLQRRRLHRRARRW